MFNATPLPGNGATGTAPPGHANRVGSALAREAPAPEAQVPSGQSRAAMVAAWLAGIPRRLGTRLFSSVDEEANWRGWQTIRLCCGLARCYRDARFGPPGGAR